MSLCCKVCHRDPFFHDDKFLNYYFWMKYKYDNYHIRSLATIMDTCVCVCQRERERERDYYKFARARESLYVRVFVCVYMRMCVHARARPRFVLKEQNGGSEEIESGQSFPRSHAFLILSFLRHCMACQADCIIRERGCNACRPD